MAKTNRSKPAKRAGSDSAATRRKKWLVVVLQKAIDEGRKELNDGEYLHIVKILKKLVNFGSKLARSELDIKPIDGIHELREKGGLLGKKNMRFFFEAIAALNEVVIAKTYRKDEEGQTPRHIVINAKTRLAAYKAGKEKVGARHKSKTTTTQGDSYGSGSRARG